MIQVFTRFDVYHKTLGGTVLMWDLHQKFIAGVEQPFTFTVHASRSGAGDWAEIARIEDGYNYLVDPNRWNWAKDVRIHYRVTVETADGHSFDTGVRQAYGNLPHEARLVAKEIVRKEQMLLEKKTGIQGLLYKRRHWGVQCHECTDYDTQEPTGNGCSNCYDTGLVGGYFDPISVWMDFRKASGRKMSLEEPTQTTENQSKHGRTIACPWLDTRDVWVSCQTDQRFIVNKVTAVDYRGVPLIFDPVDLRLAQSSDIVYTLGRTEESSSSPAG